MSPRRRSWRWRYRGYGRAYSHPPPARRRSHPRLDDAEALLCEGARPQGRLQGSRRHRGGGLRRARSPDAEAPRGLHRALRHRPPRDRGGRARGRREQGAGARDPQRGPEARPRPRRREGPVHRLRRLAGRPLRRGQVPDRRAEPQPGPGQRGPRAGLRRTCLAAELPLYRALGGRERVRHVRVAAVLRDLERGAQHGPRQRAARQAAGRYPEREDHGLLRRGEVLRALRARRLQGVQGARALQECDGEAGRARGQGSGLLDDQGLRLRSLRPNPRRPGTRPARAPRPRQPRRRPRGPRGLGVARDPGAPGLLRVCVFGNLCDVPGVLVGHATDLEAFTGCTAVVFEEPAVVGVDVRGSSPGTRETDRLGPHGTVRRTHALLLTGGSAFGLAAAEGVVRFLEEGGVGFDIGVARIPLLSAAVLFDLVVGDPGVRPGPEMGYEAAASAKSADFAQGSVGAGAGATVGKVLGLEGAMKGGVGSASVALDGGLVVGALAAVNAFGDVRDPRTGRA